MTDPADHVSGVQSFLPGTEGYETATSPQNAAVRQRPALVAAPVDGEQVAACVRHAAERGLMVVPQATGHGATAGLGDNVLLLDTTGLNRIKIDAAQRRAVVGAGCTWGAVNGQAENSGLLGRGGSAPDVGVAGFTFGAGAGWLTRPWGLASSALTAVEYVDGAGTVRRASDDATDQIDRDVMWAYRGGGGVGIATLLEFDLVEVDDLWAGYLLWPVEALDAVVAAWLRSLSSVGPALATSLGILKAPPAPPIPPELQGTTIIVLSVASSAGPSQAQALLDALADAPKPAADTWGPSDAGRLATIHLDPQGPAPAWGVARWLDSRFLDIARDLYAAAARTGVVQFEVRHVANDAAVLPGALDRAPGDFMLHAVGPPDLDTLDADLTLITTAAERADVGLAIGSWSDGRVQVSDGLPRDVRARVADIADRIDPDRTLARSPLVAGL